MHKNTQNTHLHSQNNDEANCSWNEVDNQTSEKHTPPIYVEWNAGNSQLAFAFPLKHIYIYIYIIKMSENFVKCSVLKGGSPCTDPHLVVCLWWHKWECECEASSVCLHEQWVCINQRIALYKSYLLLLLLLKSKGNYTHNQAIQINILLCENSHILLSSPASVYSIHQQPWHLKLFLSLENTPIKSNLGTSIIHCTCYLHLV